MMGLFSRPAVTAPAPAQPQALAAEPVTPTIPTPEPEHPLVIAIAGMTVPQLVSLRSAVEAEITRLQLAIPVEAERARAAFEGRDPETVAAAFEAQDTLAARLADEQARLSALAAQLTNSVAADIAAQRALMQRHLDGLNTQAVSLTSSFAAAVAALAEVVATIEDGGRRADLAAHDASLAARDALSSLTGGHTDAASQLVPVQRPIADYMDAVEVLHNLDARARAVADNGLLAHRSLN